MADIDQIINISISQQTAAVQQVGFGVPLILGPTGFDDSDIIRFYTSPSEMLEDGFTTSDPEYKAAVKACAQALSPVQFAVGKFTAAVAQVDTGTPDVTLQEIQDFDVTIDGVEYSFTSDSDPTATEVVTGLKALINADTDCPAAATGTTTLILTAKVAGVGFTTTVSANIDLVLTTPNHSIAEDIAAIQLVNDSWYGLICTDHTEANVLQIAEYIETQTKIYGTSSADTDIIGSATDDIASQLKALAYKRTFSMYSADAANYPEAAWIGGQLPETPGSSTWKFKQLVGITPDVLTATQRQRCIGNPIAGTTGKNANIYETIGGTNITEEGFMASGQFIDLTIGIDWLQATMQTNIYSLLVQQAKVPYTDQGAAVVENAVRQTILQGVTNGLVDGDSEIEVEFPAVADQSTNDRANRILAGGTFSCRLAGALHFVVINGVVTV